MAPGIDSLPTFSHDHLSESESRGGGGGRMVPGCVCRKVRDLDPWVLVSERTDMIQYVGSLNLDML